MYLIPIGWIYVVLMMCVAEATSTTGSVLGAMVTFVLYGVLPVALILYFMGTPGRKRALRAQELALREQAMRDAAPEPGAASVEPDAGGHAPTDAIAPVREKS